MFVGNKPASSCLHSFISGHPYLVNGNLMQVQEELCTVAVCLAMHTSGGQFNILTEKIMLHVYQNTAREKQAFFRSCCSGNIILVSLVNHLLSVPYA